MAQSNAAASTDFLNSLPKEILLKIFLHLSPQSAVQCKSVCKQWRSLISASSFPERQDDQFHNSFSFLTEYWSHTRSTNLMIKIRGSTGVQLVNSLNFLPCFRPQDQEQPIHVAAYFKDLLVCCDTATVYPNVYYICNPLTKQFLMLPPAPKRQVETVLGLVCYTHPCTHARYTYKLVRIHKFDGYRRKFNVDIFCSETGKWSESVVISSQLLSSWYRSDLVAYNGILHWIDEGKRIVAYDPLNDVERCRVIDSPIYEEGRDYVTVERMGVCGGRLRICQRISYMPSYECMSTKLSVWEIGNYGEGKWTREKQLNMKDLDYAMIKRVPTSTQQPGLLGFHPYDEDIVFLTFPGSVVECNMTTRVLEEVCTLRHESGQDIIRLGDAVLQLVHPLRPTPVPPLPAGADVQRILSSPY